MCYSRYIAQWWDKMSPKYDTVRIFVGSDRMYIWQPIKMESFFQCAEAEFGKV